MPPAIQVKLLRTLQERVVRPVGSTRSIAFDVRVICATHHDLAAAVADGNFRQDLYYRVKGIELAVPALRHRREDIPLLADYFLDGAAAKTGSPRKTLAATAIDRMLDYNWPGNVRELEHVIMAAASMASADEITTADLAISNGEPKAGAIPDVAAFMDLPLTEAKTQLVDALERAMIKEALSRHGGNISAAARQLGIHRQNLQQKLAQLGIAKNGE